MDVPIGMYWHEGPVDGPVNWAAYVTARAGTAPSRFNTRADAKPAWVHVPPEAANSQSLKGALIRRPAAELDRIVLHPLWEVTGGDELAQVGRLVKHLDSQAHVDRPSLPSTARGLEGTMAVPVTADHLEATTDAEAVAVRVLPPHLAADREAYAAAVERAAAGTGSPVDRVRDWLAALSDIRARWQIPVEVDGQDLAQGAARSAGTWMALAVRLLWWGPSGTLGPWTDLQRQVLPSAPAEAQSRIGAPAVPLDASRVVALLAADPGSGLLIWTGTGLEETFRGALLADRQGNLVLVNPRSDGNPVQQVTADSLSWLAGPAMRGVLLDVDADPVPWTEFVRMDAPIEGADPVATVLGGLIDSAGRPPAAAAGATGTRSPAADVLGVTYARPVEPQALMAIPPGAVTPVSVDVAGRSVLVHRVSADEFQVIEPAADGGRRTETFLLSEDVPLPSRIALPVGADGRVVALDLASRLPVTGGPLPALDADPPVPVAAPLASWRWPAGGSVFDGAPDAVREGWAGDPAAPSIDTVARDALLAVMPDAIGRAVSQLTGTTSTGPGDRSSFILSGPAFGAGAADTVTLAIRVAGQAALGSDALRVQRGPNDSLTVLVSERLAQFAQAGDEAAGRLSWLLGRAFLSLFAQLRTRPGSAKGKEPQRADVLTGDPAGGPTLALSDVAVVHELAVLGEWMRSGEIDPAAVDELLPLIDSAGLWPHQAGAPRRAALIREHLAGSSLTREAQRNVTWVLDHAGDPGWILDQLDRGGKGLAHLPMRSQLALIQARTRAELATAETGPGPVTEPVPELPSSRDPAPPVYLGYGALGDLEVVAPPEVSDEDLERTVDAILDRLPELPAPAELAGDLDPAVEYVLAAPPGEAPVHLPGAQRFAAETRSEIRQAVRAELADLFRAAEAGTDPVGEAAREKWERALFTGRVVVAGGRAIWIRPVLSSPTKIDYKPSDTRRYGVGFSGTTTSTADSVAPGGSWNLGMDAAGPLDFINPFIPQLSIQSASGLGSSSTAVVFGGHRLFVPKLSYFSAGIAFEIYIDGSEDGQPWTTVPSDTTMTTGWPEILSTASPRPADATVSTVLPDTGAEPRPVSSRVVLNAINPVPLISRWLRELRKSLTAPIAADVLRQGVDQLLNERTLRMRDQVLFDDGEQTDRIQARSGTASFNGYLVLRPTQVGIEMVDITDGITTRADRGVAAIHGLNASHPAGFKISKAWGLPGLPWPIASAGLGIGGGYNRTSALGVTATGQNHTVIMQRGPHARYRVSIELTLMTRSGATVAPVTVTVVAERSVILKDAAAFEREIFGRVFSPELGAAGTAPARATLPPPVTRPDYRVADGLLPVPAPDDTVPTTTTGDVVFWRPGDERAPWPPVRDPAADRHPYPPKMVVEFGEALPSRSWSQRSRTPEGMFLEIFGAAPYRLGAPQPKPGESASMVMRRGGEHLQALVLIGGEKVGSSLSRVLGAFDTVISTAVQGDGVLDWGKIPMPAGEVELGPEARRRVVQRAGKNAMEADDGRIQVGRLFDVSVRAKADDIRTVDYRVLVLTRRGDHTGTEQYQLTVNSRSVGAQGTSGSLATSFSADVPGFAGISLPFAAGLRFALSAGYSSSAGDKLSYGQQQYRRTETDGDVLDQQYGAEYLIAVLRPKDGKFLAWTLDFANNGTAARIVVPMEYVPRTPDGMLRTLTPSEVQQGSQLRPVTHRAWESQNHLPFASAGTDGIVAKFASMPELIRHAAEGLGFPAATLEDAMRWPAELFDLAAPDTWGQYFDELTGPRGHRTQVTLPDGTVASVVTKVRVTGLRPMPGTAETEHYRRTETGAQRHATTALSLGGKAQVPVHAGALGVVPSGNVGGAYDWGDAESYGTQSIGRATYPDSAQYQANFSVALTFSTTGRTTVFAGSGLLNLLVPDSKLLDLLSFVPHLGTWVVEALESAEPPPPIQDFRQVSPFAPVFPGARMAPELRHFDRIIGVDLFNAFMVRMWERRRAATQAPRELIDPSLRDALFAEWLSVPDLLDGIVGGVEGMGLQLDDLLRAALDASFAPDKVTNQYPMLPGGIVRWYPVRSPLRSGTSYLLISINGRTDEQATTDLARDGIALTMRRQATGSNTITSGWKLSYGGGITGSISESASILPFSVLDGSGLGQGLGVTRATNLAGELSADRSTKDIFRAQPKQSHEFNHPITVQVQIQLLRELPEPLRSLKKLLQLTGSSISWLAGFEELSRDLWRAADGPYGVERSGLSVDGNARLLAPLAITAPKARPGVWSHHAGTPPELRGNEGIPRARWAQPAPERPDLNRELIHELRTNQTLYPWTLGPLARAFQSFIEQAERSAPGRPLDAEDGLAPRPGASGMTAGREHFHLSEAKLVTAMIQLLEHEYRVPGTDVTLGVDLWHEEVYQDADGATRSAAMKGRRYQQVAQKSALKEKGTVSQGVDGSFSVHTPFGGLSASPVWSGKTDHTGSASSKQTRERNAERVGSLEHFRYDLTGYLKGPKGTVELRLNRAMWISRAADRTPPAARALTPLTVAERPGDGLLDEPRPAGPEQVTQLLDEAASTVADLVGEHTGLRLASPGTSPGTETPPTRRAFTVESPDGTTVFALRVEATADVRPGTAAELTDEPATGAGEPRGFVLRVWDRLSTSALHRAVSQAAGAVLHASRRPGWTPPPGAADVLRAGSVVPDQPVLGPRDVGWLHHLRALAREFVQAPPAGQTALGHRALVVYQQLGLAAGMPRADERMGAVLDFLYDTELFPDGDRLALVELSRHVDDLVPEIAGWEGLLAGPEVTLPPLTGGPDAALTDQVRDFATSLIQLAYQRLFANEPLPRPVVTLPGGDAGTFREARAAIVDGLLIPALAELAGPSAMDPGGQALPITVGQLMPEVRAGSGDQARLTVRTDVAGAPARPVRRVAGPQDSLSVATPLTGTELTASELPARLTPMLRQLADAVATGTGPLFEAGGGPGAVRVDIVMFPARPGSATPEQLRQAGALIRAGFESSVRSAQPHLSPTTSVSVVDGPAADLARTAGPGATAGFTLRVTMPPGAATPATALTVPAPSSSFTGYRAPEAEGPPAVPDDGAGRQITDWLRDRHGLTGSFAPAAGADVWWQWLGRSTTAPPAEGTADRAGWEAGTGDPTHLKLTIAEGEHGDTVVTPRMLTQLQTLVNDLARAESAARPRAGQQAQLSVAVYAVGGQPAPGLEPAGQGYADQLAAALRQLLIRKLLPAGAGAQVSAISLGLITQPVAGAREWGVAVWWSGNQPLPRGPQPGTLRPQALENSRFPVEIVSRQGSRSFAPKIADNDAATWETMRELPRQIGRAAAWSSAAGRPGPVVHIRIPDVDQLGRDGAPVDGSGTQRAEAVFRYLSTSLIANTRSHLQLRYGNRAKELFERISFDGQYTPLEVGDGTRTPVIEVENVAAPPLGEPADWLIDQHIVEIDVTGVDHGEQLTVETFDQFATSAVVRKDLGLTLPTISVSVPPRGAGWAQNTLRPAFDEAVARAVRRLGTGLDPKALTGELWTGSTVVPDGAPDSETFRLILTDLSVPRALGPSNGTGPSGEYLDPARSSFDMAHEVAWASFPLGTAPLRRLGPVADAVRPGLTPVPKEEWPQVIQPGVAPRPPGEAEGIPALFDTRPTRLYRSTVRVEAAPGRFVSMRFLRIKLEPMGPVSAPETARLARHARDAVRQLNHRFRYPSGDQAHFVLDILPEDADEGDHLTVQVPHTLGGTVAATPTAWPADLLDQPARVIRNILAQELFHRFRVDDEYPDAERVLMNTAFAKVWSDRTVRRSALGTTTPVVMSDADTVTGHDLPTLIAARYLFQIEADQQSRGTTPVVTFAELQRLTGGAVPAAPRLDVPHLPDGVEADGMVLRIGARNAEPGAPELYRQLKTAAATAAFPVVFLDTPAGRTPGPELLRQLDATLQVLTGAGRGAQARPKPMVVTAAAVRRDPLPDGTAPGDLAGIVHGHGATLLAHDTVSGSRLTLFGGGWRVVGPGRAGPLLGATLTPVVLDAAHVEEPLPDGVVPVMQHLHTGFYAVESWWNTADAKERALAETAAREAAAAGTGTRVLVVGISASDKRPADRGSTGPDRQGYADIPRNRAFDRVWRDLTTVARAVRSFAAFDAASRSSVLSADDVVGRRPEVLALSSSPELLKTLSSLDVTVIDRSGPGSASGGGLTLDWAWQVTGPSVSGTRKQFAAKLTSEVFTTSHKLNAPVPGQALPEPIAALLRAETLQAKLEVADRYGAQLRTEAMRDVLAGLTGFADGDLLGTLRRWGDGLPGKLVPKSSEARSTPDFTVPTPMDEPTRHLAAIHVLLTWSAAQPVTPPAAQVRHPMETRSLEVHPPLTGPIGASTLRNYLQRASQEGADRTSWDWLLIRALYQPDANGGRGLTPGEAAALAVGVARTPQDWATAMVFVAIAAHVEGDRLGIDRNALNGLLDKIIGSLLCDLPPLRRAEWVLQGDVLGEVLRQHAPHAALDVTDRIKNTIGC
ncbi:hypothetical protein J2S43_004712 [Catenuloplanes nepalensis]|uniref:Uncharacterized protein n=1 Tax=Catenuloplanes nepalensis TaxID=587533 RepID=A0ABT9MXT7_9ACTN|nr:hypothetical protein [Catenuloplanes nepalensis]MDP9796200.1 hypothetical protein [Catenuloplanes nepalensis]